MEELYHGNSSSEELTTLDEGTHFPRKEEVLSHTYPAWIPQKHLIQLLLIGKILMQVFPTRTSTKKSREEGLYKQIVQIHNLRHWHSPCSLT
jgi:hypothetical protein